MSDQMLVNGGDVHDQALVLVPWPGAELPSGSEGTGVIEAESSLMIPQTPEAGIPAVEGPYPVLHLHRHIHAGVIDDEARVVISRLAEQHGELFTYLHDQVTRAQESLQERAQFEKDLVAWVGTTREVLESQWLRTERMAAGLADVQETARIVREDVGRLSDRMTRRTESLEQRLRDFSGMMRAEIAQLWDHGQ